MPTVEWLNKYESVKDKLACKTNLDTYFSEKTIGNMEVAVLDVGSVHFPTGKVIACDPLVSLVDAQEFMQTIPAGTYPVQICVVPSEKYGDRYACVKVSICDQKPVRYELAMSGTEDLDEELDDDAYFGFGVDAGMGCIADIKTQEAFKTYWAKREEEDPGIDPFNDLFDDLLEENAEANQSTSRNTEIGSTGQFRIRNTTSLSSPPAGVMGTIQSILVMTPATKSAPFTCTSSTLKPAIGTKNKEARNGLAEKSENCGLARRLSYSGWRKKVQGS